MKIYEVTAGGITLALVMVCYTLLTGTANILNAILVPLLLFGCFSKQGGKAIIATVIAFLFLTLLLHRLQLAFSFFYILSSLLLTVLTKKNARLPLQTALLSGTAFISFVVAIKSTDLIFLTKIESFMLQLAGGSHAILYLIFALESLLVGSGIAFGARHLTYLLTDKAGTKPI